LSIERPQAGERAILVYIKQVSQAVNTRPLINVSQWPEQEDLTATADDSDELADFKELAKSAGVAYQQLVVSRRQSPDAKTFIGRGKLAELVTAVTEQQAQVVLFSCQLSPAQERNLERALKCRVVDRIGLILDIFAQRARSYEGKLQVELAQLRHLSTRLVRGWTHLERQKGGIGLRGPGETQLETDRRLLAQRIKTINKKLGKVQQQRGLSRQARKRAGMPGISLVGYTNAGKSSLFNRLTEASVYIADQQFATLDPTLRRVQLPYFGQVVMADTVGFVRQLPHSLIKAFRATLEETCEARLLLHIVDAHDPQRQQRIEQVNAVLAEIGAQHIPQLQIYNKLDRLPSELPRVDRDQQQRPVRVWLSALTGRGIDLLTQAIAQCLAGELVERDVILRPDQGQLRAQLYQQQMVVAETCLDSGECQLKVRMSRDRWHYFHRQGLA
jgi:GTP-binding protein HflX